MMKRKRYEIGFLVLILIICLHLIGVKSMACEVQTVTANVTYPEGWFLTYSPNNPETIEPSSEETIRIFGCRPPFTWSVEGNGFDLSDDETVTLFNTLGADGTACGSATITITDSFGESDKGYVRCTTGIWLADKIPGCMVPGYAGTSYPVPKIFGIYRQYHTLKAMSAMDGYCDDVMKGKCELYWTYQGCDPVYHCTPCLTYGVDPPGTLTDVPWYEADWGDYINCQATCTTEMYYQVWGCP